MIADKINFLASKPEMRLQGVIVENFNKTDENDVYHNQLSLTKLIMRNQIYIFLGNKSEESESDEPEPRRNVSLNEKLD